MKLLELHILQSFPVTCLNRDDAGMPKTAVFGGVTRARISSQCQKRAIRMLAASERGDLFGGKRTKYMVADLVDALGEHGQSDEHRLELAIGAVAAFGKYDDKSTGSKADCKIKTLYYLAPNEVGVIAEKLAELAEESADDWATLVAAEAALADAGDKPSKAIQDAPKNAKKAIHAAAKKVADKALKSIDKGTALKDAADIALFGRMVADSPDLGVDGAAMFSHALSTHEAEPQPDFYSALDDELRERLDRGEEGAHAGSGMLGVLEFTTATYYRYGAINLDMLFDEKEGYLRQLSAEDRQAALHGFISATVNAVPNARKTGMNGHCPPAYVIGEVRESAAPVQLVNAFEKPVRGGRDGMVTPSIDALVQHRKKIHDVWSLEGVAHATGFENSENEDAPEHVSMSQFVTNLADASLAK